MRRDSPTQNPEKLPKEKYFMDYIGFLVVAIFI
jgi:hypothetical protein